MNTPRIVFAPLSSRWFVLTRYQTCNGVDVASGKATRYYKAITKYDVTDQMEQILAATRKQRKAKK